MFHGIEVNVVDVSLEVPVIANSVLPVTSLPQSEVAVHVTFHGLPRAEIMWVLKCPLIRRHRPGKSASACGNVKIA
jgi:hypothetical protein